MKLLIVPTVRETYKNQFEFSVDIKLINFLKFIFGSNIQIDIYNKKFVGLYNLIIFSGGNDLPLLKKLKKNIIRFDIDNKIYNYYIKKNIPLIGICYGAQFIGLKNKFKIIKQKHLGNHKIYYNKNYFLANSKYQTVNSFHNFVITETNKHTINLAVAKDKTIELFKIDKKKILGIMWHPERRKKFSLEDKKIIKQFYDTYYSFSR